LATNKVELSLLVLIVKRQNVLTKVAYFSQRRRLQPSLAKVLLYLTIVTLNGRNLILGEKYVFKKY